MKTRSVSQIRNWTLSAVVLAGLGYSMFAMTLSPKLAYASSCDCAELKTDANEWCETHWGSILNPSSFVCPLTDSNGTQYATFTCLNGTPNALPCYY